MTIRSLSSYLVLLVLVFGTMYLWHAVPLPCEQPLEYALGDVDNRFDLDTTDILRETTAAAQLWERAAGKELFRYVPDAAFKIHFIFDDRQAQTLEGHRLESSLKEVEDTQDALDRKQHETLDIYHAESAEYERDIIAYKRQLDAYNDEVEKWNHNGGAPVEEYDRLERVSKELSRSLQALEAKRQKVNHLAQSVNAFSKQKVALIEGYNNQVEQFVGRYGAPGEFDQGEYVGKEINIYQYEDLPHLRAVLTHEFGHALGLVHGTNPQSVMYHLMKDQSLNPLALSDEDQAMLSAQCGQTIWDVLLLRMGMLKEGLFSKAADVE